MSESRDGIERSMKFCLLWGIVAMCSSILFILLLAYFFFRTDINLYVLFSALSFGFLALGASAFYRHSYVSILGLMGTRPDLRRFLLLYADILLLPFSFRRLREEVDTYRRCSRGEFNKNCSGI